jgi:hypothetical protein
MSEELSQDKKIDKLQYQMESLQVDFKDFKQIQRETNARLETMQKGFVGREEFKEFQGFVRDLATQKDLDQTKQDVKALEDWNTWAVRIVVGAVILAVIGGVLITNN